MYKVFVNEKKFSIEAQASSEVKNLLFEDSTTFEIALDLLLNTSTPGITVYGEEPEKIWQKFAAHYKRVSAAGGIVQRENGDILFIKRLGKWDLPKGKVEPGETLPDAAVREVMEETELDWLKIQYFIDTTFHMYREKTGQMVLKDTHWFKMEFLGTKEAKPQVEEGITEVSWKNDQDIENQVFKNTFQNIHLILGQMRKAETGPSQQRD